MMHENAGGLSSFYFKQANCGFVCYVFVNSKSNGAVQKSVWSFVTKLCYS